MVFSTIRISREYARNPLAASGRSVLAALFTMRLPTFCSTFLAGEKCSTRCDLAVGDDDVRRAGDDRLHQLGDLLLGVLVVAVGVDQDVGAELEGPHDAVVEGPAEALVAGVVHELPDPVGLGHLDRAVRRAVVDDQHDDLVDRRRSPSGSTPARGEASPPRSGTGPGQQPSRQPRKPWLDRADPSHHRVPQGNRCAASVRAPRRRRDHQGQRSRATTTTPEAAETTTPAARPGAV